MHQLTDIRRGIRDVISHGIEQDLYVYDALEELGQVPCVIIEPYKADYQAAMQNGTEVWTFYLYVLAPRSPGQGFGQFILDEMISPLGPNSVRRALSDDGGNLGLGDVDVTVHGMKQYGNKFEWARVDHVGCVLVVEVVDMS